jgi:hypothetical protein
MGDQPVSVIKGDELYVHYGGRGPRENTLEEDNELWCKSDLNKNLYCLLIVSLDKMSDDDKHKILDFIRHDILKIERLRCPIIL